MSSFVCPHCNKESQIFRATGGKQAPWPRGPVRARVCMCACAPSRSLFLCLSVSLSLYLSTSLSLCLSVSPSLRLCLFVSPLSLSRYISLYFVPVLLLVRAISCVLCLYACACECASMPVACACVMLACTAHPTRQHASVVLSSSKACTYAPVQCTPQAAWRPCAKTSRHPSLEGEPPPPPTDVPGRLPRHLAHRPRVARVRVAEHAYQRCATPHPHTAPPARAAAFLLCRV